ncbi:Golgi to ER traffic- protein [Ceratobasidium sp. 394]|nr:Golgi to ER traffic- protein [Ceratobasidium sp. 394]
MADEFETLPPTLQNVLDQTTLKWIFCGGKGGVGKTTTSCSLAIQLAACRESVLLISTDPAHNLSDAFGQKFSKEATKVNGFNNLFAMELDPTSSIQEMIEQSDNQGAMGSMMQDLAFAIPGVDEAMGFAEIMKHVKSMEYSVIVFDTAPTGHTLRFLSFPSVLEKALGKISSLSGRFGPMLQQMSAMMGGPGAGQQEDMFAKLDGMRAIITEVNQQFKDPVSYSVSFVWSSSTILTWRTCPAGKDNIRLRVHLRVPIAIRDRAPRTRTHDIRNRHSQHRRKPAPLPQENLRLRALQRAI